MTGSPDNAAPLPGRQLPSVAVPAREQWKAEIERQRRAYGTEAAELLLGVFESASEGAVSAGSSEYLAYQQHLALVREEIGDAATLTELPAGPGSGQQVVIGPEDSHAFGSAWLDSIAEQYGFELAADQRWSALQSRLALIELPLEPQERQVEVGEVIDVEDDGLLARVRRLGAAAAARLNEAINPDTETQLDAQDQAVLDALASNPAVPAQAVLDALASNPAVPAQAAPTEVYDWQQTGFGDEPEPERGIDVRKVGAGLASFGRRTSRAVAAAARAVQTVDDRLQNVGPGNLTGKPVQTTLEEHQVEAPAPAEPETPAPAADPAISPAAPRSASVRISYDERGRPVLEDMDQTTELPVVDDRSAGDERSQSL
jgi:hypothetical protein